MLESRQNEKSISSRQEGSSCLPFDLVCFSHLRWKFVYQRPQHLLSRCAQQRRVFFIEEPIFADEASLDIREEQPGVWVVVPHLPAQMTGKDEETNLLQQQLINELLATYMIHTYVLWYYNPLAVSFSEHLKPLATIYDCMDELSGFKGASPLLKQCKAQLLTRTDLVFTGGYSLYEAKCLQHRQVHAFLSSVDTAHFSRARVIQQDPSDQAHIPHLRLGFYGVIDECFDVDLLRAVADAQPDWHFILNCLRHYARLKEVWQRYHIPMAMIEVHLNSTRDEQIRWFLQSWQTAMDLRNEGTDIRAVTAWSLLGSFDWNSLLTRNNSFYEPGVFDIRAPRPRPTALAKVIHSITEGREAEHPVLGLPGSLMVSMASGISPIQARSPRHNLSST